MAEKLTKLLIKIINKESEVEDKHQSEVRATQYLSTTKLFMELLISHEEKVCPGFFGCPQCMHCMAAGPCELDDQGLDLLMPGPIWWTPLAFPVWYGGYSWAQPFFAKENQVSGFFFNAPWRKRCCPVRVFQLSHVCALFRGSKSTKVKQLILEQKRDSPDRVLNRHRYFRQLLNGKANLACTNTCTSYLEI